MAKPAGDDAPSDETAELPDAPDAERTSELPGPAPAGPAGVGPSGTAVLPPVPTSPSDERAPWAGRASVPRVRLEADDEDGWAEPPRSQLFPVFAGVVVVALLGILTVGVVLLLRDRPSAPAPPPAPTSVVVSTRPSRPAPTTAAPSTSAPATLVLPQLSGQDYESTAATLVSLGLVPQRQDVFHDWPVGIVTATDPPEGTEVTVGQTITVFVSKGPQPTVAASSGRPSSRPSSQPSPKPSSTAGPD